MTMMEWARQEAVTYLVVRAAGVPDLVDDKLESIQDEELCVFEDVKVDLHGAGESAFRQVGFERNIITFWDCELR